MATIAWSRCLARQSRSRSKQSVKDQESGNATDVTFGRFDVEFLLAQATGDSEALALFPSLFWGMSKGNYDYLANYILRLRTRGILPLMSVALD